MIIENITPKLFYGTFPYKIVLKRGNNTVKKIEKDLITTKRPWKRVKIWGEHADRWYMSELSQRGLIVNRYSKLLMEMSSPHSENHLHAMIEGQNSIFRDRKYFSTYKYAVKFSNLKGWAPHGEKLTWLLKLLCEQGMHPGIDYELRRRNHLSLYTNDDNLILMLKLYHNDSIISLVNIKQSNDF